MEIPGCGNRGAKYGADYCVNKSDRPSNYLVIKGRKLGDCQGDCQGDCDNDGDCIEDLECFKRNRQALIPWEEWEEVPGCEGKGEKNKDYCYDPNLWFEALSICEIFQIQIREKWNRRLIPGRFNPFLL